MAALLVHWLVRLSPALVLLAFAAATVFPVAFLVLFAVCMVAAECERINGP